MFNSTQKCPLPTTNLQRGLTGPHPGLRMFAAPARAHVPGGRGGRQCKAEIDTQAAEGHERSPDTCHQQTELQATKVLLPHLVLRRSQTSLSPTPNHRDVPPPGSKHLGPAKRPHSFGAAREAASAATAATTHGI
eukprot:4191840-Alexandrium_andersonii.AAC.1